MNLDEVGMLLPMNYADYYCLLSALLLCTLLLTTTTTEMNLACALIQFELKFHVICFDSI